MAKLSILAGLLAYLALVLSVAQALDFHCEKKAKMSMDEYQRTCVGLDSEDFSEKEYAFEAKVDKIEECACFFVNQRVAWSVLATPAVRALSESPRFAMGLDKALVTSYEYQSKAFSKYVVSANEYLRKEVKQYLTTNLQNGPDDDYMVRVCTALKERFGLFRGFLLKLRKAALNDGFAYLVAGQDEGLARLMIASHVCHGAYQVDMHHLNHSHFSKIPSL